jgi:hypothetical protein
MRTIVQPSQQIIIPHYQHTWAWWQNLDVSSRYVGIDRLHATRPQARFLHRSGGLLPRRNTSCNVRVVVRKRLSTRPYRSMSNDDALLSELLSTPPHGRLDFALCFSGCRGTPSFYHGFHAPAIVTPTIHILPPTVGWGCGSNRLMMLFAGKERIGDVLSFGNLRAVTRGAKKREG